MCRAAEGLLRRIFVWFRTDQKINFVVCPVDGLSVHSNAVLLRWIFPFDSSGHACSKFGVQMEFRSKTDSQKIRKALLEQKEGPLNQKAAN